MKTWLLLTLLTVMLFVFVPPASASYLYLSPDSGSFAKDSTASFEVRLNTQDEVINGVSVYLAFPQDKLEAKSVEINKALLPIVAEETVDGNVIKMSGGNFSSMSGNDLKIGTVSFKTKTLGSALIDFIPGSAAPRTIDSTDSLSLSSSKSVTIQIKDGDSTSNPTPKPSDRKTVRCQERESSIKSGLNVITIALTDFKTRLDTIYVLVDDYYTNVLVPGGKSSSAYTNQRQQVDAKRNLALDKLNSYKNDASGFNCTIKNPNDRLNQLKRESRDAKSALNDYKSNLQNLIRILRRI